MPRVVVADETLIKKGLNSLVRSLGIGGASRFILGIERGEGDSVQEFRKMWKGKSAREIHRNILENKRKT